MSSRVAESQPELRFVTVEIPVIVSPTSAYVSRRIDTSVGAREAQACRAVQAALAVTGDQAARRHAIRTVLAAIADAIQAAGEPAKPPAPKAEKPKPKPKK